MSEKRYTLKMCAEFCGLHPTAIHARGKKLGMDTSRGLTAANLKAIIQFGRLLPNEYGNMEDLRREMEALR